MVNRLLTKLILILIPIVLLTISCDAKAQKNLRKQTRIKAAFIFQMAKFITWPMPPDQPVVFCTFQNNRKFNIVSVLQTLKNQGKLTLSSRRIELQLLKGNVEDSTLYKPCTVIYFHNKIEQKIPAALLLTLSRKKLLVGNSIAFLEKGGLAALVPEDGKNRLYINRLTYEQSEIKIRSRLMALARMHPK